ncbi:cation diffusion facilitator family transporter [Desulfotruncus alcoholivorax]|uniref:cation diffusion facilitator family transporter n=1 Tax=Desulfotruncus alcoholivorax TaxID=265477 RepID=UPI000416C92B|nr:cation diffusion facilitator family transporter [Desulfotruncus alcoholivorax]
MEARVKAGWISVAGNVILIALKLSVGILTGTVSVIAEAVHSVTDLLSSFIALFAVKKAGMPSDEKHPYGYAKVENVSATVEALLIFLAAFLIIRESIIKIRYGSELTPVGWGIAVMGVSVAVNILVSLYMSRVARDDRSIALEADAMHHWTDVYTSLGVLLGLVLIHFTGLAWLDPAVAIGVAVFIIKAAWDITRESFSPLMDASISPDEIKQIKQVLDTYQDEYIEYHNLRTRRAGSEIYLDLHLVTCSRMSVKQVHDLSDAIEEKIKDIFPHCHVLIHAEPGQQQSRCDACAKGNGPGRRGKRCEPRPYYKKIPDKDTAKNTE